MQSSFLEDMFLGSESGHVLVILNVNVKFSFIIYPIPWPEKTTGTGFRWQIATVVSTSQFTEAKDEQKFMIKVSEDRIVI